MNHIMKAKELKVDDQFTLPADSTIHVVRDVTVAEYHKNFWILNVWVDRPGVKVRLKTSDRVILVGRQK